MWMWQLAVQLGADPRGILDGAPLGSRCEMLETELEKWRARQRQVQARKPEQAERRRETAVQRARVTFEAWAEQHKDTIAALAPFRHDSGDNFLQSLAIQVTDGWNGKPKPLSEAQEAAALRAIEGRQHRQAELERREAAKRDVPEGRVPLAGRIVKATVRDHKRWGSQTYITVSCDGYAVQLPMPREVSRWANEHRSELVHKNWRPGETTYAAAERWTGALRGLDVALTATVKRSDRDPSFGFGSRAAAVTVQDPAAEPEPERGAELAPGTQTEPDTGR